MLLTHSPFIVRNAQILKLGFDFFFSQLIFKSVALTCKFFKTKYCHFEEIDMLGNFGIVMSQFVGEQADTKEKINSFLWRKSV